MQIWPAIDLLDGKCVRLRQGEYDQLTVYGDDPLAMAQHWVSHGADCLHLVDLDGAKEGRPKNLAAVREIVRQSGVPCQFGGGVRDDRAIEQLLELGVSRIVLGTKALKEPAWFQAAAERFARKLVLGIDAKNGKVATDGWLVTSEQRAVALARQFEGLPLAGLVYTDIAKDGMLQGPNLEAMAEMQQSVALPVVASGGVTCAQDVSALAQLGMAGCIIGRALYEGKLTLPAALAASSI